jgi:site-specific DNA-methyltransferase (adenine-specific)
METNKIYNEDNITGMARIPDNSINCILTDPPYLYLKNQKLDRPFNEALFFSECKRVLKKEGFIVLSGRGTSFYRWNTILADLGFKFKEEIVWNKSYTSSPMLALSRVHETISLHSIDGAINKVRVPYIDMRDGDINGIRQDIKRLMACFSSTNDFQAVYNYLENKEFELNGNRKTGVTIGSEIKHINVAAATMRFFSEGIIEKSIIMEVGNNYNRIHPTQKPVRLLERLLALTTKPGDIVLDPLAGSCSTAVACYNTDRQFICFEIDKEYYYLASERVSKVIQQTKVNFID